jgi:hypothetical protein
MMMRIPHIAIILVLLLTIGCVSAEFKPWTSDKVHKGEGGSLQQIEGIDVWELGMPDREFKIIGVIHSGTPFSLGTGLTL